MTAIRDPKISIDGETLVHVNEDRRQEHLALEDVSLDISDGEFLCVVGPSG